MSFEKQAISQADFMNCSSELSMDHNSKPRSKMLKKPRFYFESIDINPEEIAKVSYSLKREFNFESERFEFVKNTKNSLELN